jgi:hypothetical protein
MRARRMMAMGMFGKREINKTCPAIAPTLSIELLADGGFEAWTSPTNLTNWSEDTPAGGSINQESTVVQAGSNACRVDLDATGPNVRPWQQKTGLGAYAWLLASVYARNSVAGKTARIDIAGDGTSPSAVFALSSTTYQQFFRVWRGSNTGSGVLYPARQSAASSSIYWDTASLKAMTFSTCLSLLGDIHRKNGTYVCHPTLTFGTIAGMLIEFLDENNFVMMYIDGANAQLVSRIGGAYAIVKTGTITYSAAAELRVIVSGTTHKLYYNGLQVSTDGTIDNSGLGTKVYGFNTFDGNAVGAVATSPSVTP